ncbi:hypothetical protein J3E69DRAFT_352778 [Trichoderma sp. SZMC 28015]
MALDCLPLLDRGLSPLVTLLGSEQCQKVQVCSVGRIKRPALSEARYHYCTLRPSSSEEEGSLGCFQTRQHWSVQHIGEYLRSTLFDVLLLHSTFDYIVAFLMLVSSHLGIDRLLDSMTSCVLLSPAKVPRQVPFLPDLSRETVLSIRNSLLGDFFIRDSLDAESTTVARESIDQGANNGGRVVDVYLQPVLDSGSYNDP